MLRFRTRDGRVTSLLLCGWLAGLTALSCGGDDDETPPDDGGPAADAAPDAGPPPTCDESTVAALDAGDPDGHADPLGASASEARAGRLTEAMLPTDSTGLAVWAAGDFVLANDRVAMIIEDAGPSDLYDPWGGKPIGVGLVEGGAIVAAADFNEAIIAIGRYTVEAESVTVVADGSDGGDAVVRTIGPLTSVPFVDELARAIAPNDYSGIDVAIDYRLAPGAEHADVTYTFRSTRATARPVPLSLMLFFQQYRMKSYAPGHGFDVALGENVSLIAFDDEDAASYAVESPNGELESFLDISGTQVFNAPAFSIAPCGIDPHPMARFHVGGPGIDALLRAMARTNGEVRRTVTGVVHESDGTTPAAGVRVHARSADGTYLTRVRTDASGAFDISLPAEDVALFAYRDGQRLGDSVTVPAMAETADLTMPARGFVHVTATEVADGGALPVRIQAVPTGGWTPIPDDLGERRVTSGRADVIFAGDGDATLVLDAAEHDVVVSRGYEYEVVTQRVTVMDATTTDVPVALDRVIDTTGAMCGDFHIHTTRSPDSEDPGSYKLLAAAADGLEIPVRSDHEFVAEFEPVIADLGLGAWMYGVTSIELTTFAWGHFGVFPMVVDASMPNDGSFDWAGRLPPAVFADVRARPSRPALIINHPRSGGGLGGYFEASGYDASSGAVTHMDMWDEDFGLVEVFNDSSFDDNYDPSGATESTVMDWFSLLRSGRRVFAVGSSDSHRVSGTPVGYPRTCMALGTDNPEVLRAMGSDVIRDTLVAGHAAVSGGIYVDAVARGGAGPGDEVTGAMARETIRVRVQAASWIDATTLRVFVDGMLAETITLDESTRDPLVPTTRFDDDVEVDVAAGGSFVVVVASGEDALEPVHPGRHPFGVTNPIFFAR